MPPAPPPRIGDPNKKKKKGRAPAHQNGFAFRHNPKSKKTEKILASPIVGVCGRCRDKIEWRKKYRKYKPLTQPAKCNLCTQRNVLAAYHTLCAKCACSDGAIDSMMEKRRGGGVDGVDAAPTAAAGGGGSGWTAAADGVVVVVAASDATTSTSTTAPAASARRRTRLHVCAVCASEPAASEFSGVPPEDMNIVESIRMLGDSLETGLHFEDGRKMTLREVRGAERGIEKLREELGDRRRARRPGASSRGGDGEEEEEEEEAKIGGRERGGGGGVDGGSIHDDDDDDDEEEEEEKEDDYDDEYGGSTDHNDGRQEDRARGADEDDPFLLATGGKALVGEDYQRMLLAREEGTATTRR